MEVLDHALVQVESSRNRYEALACWHGQMEKLVSGPLDQLAYHLPEATAVLSNKAEGTFKLVIDDSAKGAWFTKSTLSRFLHIVNTDDELKNATEIENEMSQLEETKRFQVNLYAKDEGTHFGGVTDMHIHLGDAIVSSESTKHDLLRAMDLRLTVLKEDLVATFNRASGSTCSIKEVADLAAFAEQFGATLLRNFCLKILPLFPEAKTSDTAHLQSGSSDDRKSINEDETIDYDGPRATIQKSVWNNIFPAKNFEAERERTSETEESSYSSDEDEPVVERSRPLLRSASPRRSASPMRRIQVGRSGSRRSTALTIKSLNYLPARERTIVSRDTNLNMSGDEESDQPSKKPENTARRMSVQDAISLFENKQKDQTLDVQKRRASEVAAVTNISVLRRWSAGMGDSFIHCSQGNTSGIGNCIDSDAVAKSEAEKVKIESVNMVECPKPVQSTEEDAPLEEDMKSPLDNPVTPKVEETDERAASSTEWARQKEAELNQIIMKMMESKPGKYGNSNAVSDGCQDISSEHKGDFYSQYKEKRGEKLIAENDGKWAVEVQFKLMKRTVEKSSAEMASKNGGTDGKHDSNNQSQRARRNSSSPMLTKKEGSKILSSRKASPKSSPLPTTRSSLTAGTQPRLSVTPRTKTVPSTTQNQRKSQPSQSPTLPNPRTEKPLEQPKVKKGTEANVKQTYGSREIGQQKRVTKSTKNVRNKEPPTPEVESTVQPSKPSFYNKVARKSTVVPIEPKPFLKKGARSGTRISAAVAKAKIPQMDESSKIGESPMHEKKANPMSAAELIGNTACEVQVQPADDIAASKVSPQGNDFCRTESSTDVVAAVDDTLQSSIQNPSQDLQQDIQSDADLEISSAAWVEAERQQLHASENNTTKLTESPEPAPMPSTSPHIRRSLSQMLQADNCEPEIIECGNAENPPALVYQKDAPKGLKRLLKFARKSKGDANVIGRSSPSVFSEGEDDQEESKAVSKMSSDILLRKAIQARNRGQQNTLLSESFDGGNSSKRSSYDLGPSGSGRLRNGSNPDATTSIKGSRSFFSLSTFRSSKSSEPKLR